MKKSENKDIKIILIGNKTDLEDSRIITKEEGKGVEEEYELDMFLETSLKDKNNSQDIFVGAAKLLYSLYSKSKSESGKQKDCIIY